MVQNCIFGSLCVGFQADREDDVDQHLPVFRPNNLNIGMPYNFSYQARLNELVDAHLALPEHHELSKKVDVCHKGKKTINISRNALDAHLAHGDSEGAC